MCVMMVYDVVRIRQATQRPGKNREREWNHGRSFGERMLSSSPINTITTHIKQSQQDNHNNTITTTQSQQDNHNNNTTKQKTTSTILEKNNQGEKREGKCRSFRKECCHPFASKPPKKLGKMIMADEGLVIQNGCTWQGILHLASRSIPYTHYTV